MRNKTFRFYSDGQHGWLAVKRNLLSELEILDTITNHSYERGGTVYLEEDIDAQKFIEAWLKLHNRYPKILSKDTDEPSHIRRYDYFQPRGT